MVSHGCRPDAVTFSVLVAAYERGGQWGKALQVGRCCPAPPPAALLGIEASASAATACCASWLRGLLCASRALFATRVTLCLAERFPLAPTAPCQPASSLRPCQHLPRALLPVPFLSSPSCRPAVCLPADAGAHAAARLPPRRLRVQLRAGGALGHRPGRGADQGGPAVPVCLSAGAPARARQQLPRAHRGGAHPRHRAAGAAQVAGGQRVGGRRPRRDCSAWCLLLGACFSAALSLVFGLLHMARAFF
jgi:hypothetical protein